MIGPNYVGDTLFMLPLLQSIIASFPKAELTLLLGDKGAEQVVQYQDGISHKVFCPHGITKRWKTLKALKKKWTLAFIVETSFEAALLPFLFRIPVRIGLKSEGRSLLLTHSISVDTSLHMMDRYAKLIDCIEDFPQRVNSLQFPITEFLREELAVRWNWIRNHEKPYFILCPGTTRISKMWPQDHWINLAKSLQSKYQAITIFSGSQADLPLIQNIIGKVPVENTVNVAGQTSFHELYLLMENAQAVISVDSGSLHLASSTKVPVIALFGPTNPQLTGPWNKNNAVVLQATPISSAFSFRNIIKNPKDIARMEHITVHDVLAAVHRLLDYP